VPLRGPLRADPYPGNQFFSVPRDRKRQVPRGRRCVPANVARCIPPASLQLDRVRWALARERAWRPPDLRVREPVLAVLPEGPVNDMCREA
jgi:hypothetical protein